MVIAAEKKLEINWVHSISLAIVHAFALLAFLPANFSWSAIGVTLFLHWVTGGLGITLGWHRLISHRSFKVPQWLEYFFVTCGALSCEGSFINWVGLHRLHHKHSDQHELDPHDSRRGFWWSHMTWILFKSPADEFVPRLTKDIGSDPYYRFISDYFILAQVVLGVVLLAIGGWPWVIWGIFVRLVAVYHCTWFVNSATHKFGYRTYATSDQSTNCWWVALLTYGEGWHNNHHAFQHSARHGLKWWEVDLTWSAISVLKALGLAKNVKLVEPGVKPA